MKSKKIILSSVIILSIIITLLFGIKIFGNDFNYIFKFWSTLLLLGLTFFPFTSVIFEKSHDKGWIFSKIIGLGICGLSMWLMSYTKLFKYSLKNCYIIIAFFLIINIFVGLKNKEKLKIKINTLNHILFTELIFLIVLFIFSYIRGITPVIDYSTEKYMDYGYMNSIMNSEYMPPEDIWQSGNTINYYYFGQYISGFLCKISNLNVDEGYNLMIALISALTFVMPFSIGYDLSSFFIKKKKKVLNHILSITFAFCIGFSICLGGTLHFPIYKFIDENRSSYYYANATRFIGYNPKTNDQVNTELPAYSSVVGDLHAHFIVLIFSLTSIAILLQYLTNRKICQLFLFAIILSIQKMTNYWDFVAYTVIGCIFIVAKNLLDTKFTLKTLKNVIFSIVEILAIQELLSLPFVFDFNMITSKVYFTSTHTILYQFFILWGLPILCFLALLVIFIRNKTNVNLSTIFALILGLCGLGLIIIPELVYVKDIYSEPFIRFNTVFKLTYIAYVLFAFCTNYCIMRLLVSNSKIVIVFGIILFILNASTFGYGIDAFIYTKSNLEYSSLSNTTKQLESEHPDDFAAIQWINNNISKKNVILEAASVSSSYTSYSRVSVFTGNPTPLGWYAHEWLWRNDNYQLPKNLPVVLQDINTIYTSSSYTHNKKILDKYKISYIFVGDLEYETYNISNLNNLLTLGKIIYSKGSTYIIKVTI